jgi:hypothetical protein
MLELTIYGLLGLAAMLVMAFCFGYGDELAPFREKSSFDLINKAHLNDSQMIETGTGSPRFRGTRKQRETAPASLLQTTAPAETGPGVIRINRCQSDYGQVGASRG